MPLARWGHPPLVPVTPGFDRSHGIPELHASATPPTALRVGGHSHSSTTSRIRMARLPKNGSTWSLRIRRGKAGGSSRSVLPLLGSPHVSLTFPIGAQVTYCPHGMPHAHSPPISAYSAPQCGKFPRLARHREGGSAGGPGKEVLGIHVSQPALAAAVSDPFSHHAAGSSRLDVQPPHPGGLS